MTFRGFGVGVSMLVVERPFLPLQVRPENFRGVSSGAGKFLVKSLGFMVRLYRGVVGRARF